MLVVQCVALATVWAVWNPADQFRLALLYVLLVWVVAEGITFGAFMAVSMAPFSDLLAVSLWNSASAMWLAPGVLLLAARSHLAAVAGVAAVIGSTRLLVLSRAPQESTGAEKQQAIQESERLLFRYQPEQPLLSRRTLATMFGALAMQTGIYALAEEYPLLAAGSFATATAIWVAMSVASGATEPRAAHSVPYSGTRTLLTLLLTVTLTAALLDQEIARETPAAAAVVSDSLEMPMAPSTTTRMLQRLGHVPKVEAKAPETVVTRAVDPGPAIGGKGQDGIPGVVLRPKPKPAPKLAMIVPGSQLRLTVTQSLTIPFTGEYQLFRTSSGKLPAGAEVETGTPLDRVYGTTNGGSMETIAVQEFEPPIDLTHCGKVLVTVTSAEKTPLLVLMQLVAEGSVEDGGTELLGSKRAREEVLEFQVPVAASPLLVHEIRISFQRPVLDRDKNVRVAVERMTLVPRR